MLLKEQFFKKPSGLLGYIGFYCALSGRERCRRAIDAVVICGDLGVNAMPMLGSRLPAPFGPGTERFSCQGWREQNTAGRVLHHRWDGGIIIYRHNN